MFTAAARVAVREWLVDLARADDAVIAAAIMGSGADGREDQWSDIDLALRVAPGADLGAVAEAWTRRIRGHLAPASYVDVWAQAALYRVFVLPDTLQIDVSFWPDGDFAPYGPRFRLVFGAANEPVATPEPAVDDVVGMAWLHAIHVRSSLARGRTWQAVYFINAVREYVVQLGCRRLGLPTHEGRGVDGLPPEVTAALATTMPASVQPADLREAFGRLAGLLATEARHVDPVGADRLDAVLAELVRTADPDAAATPAAGAAPDR
jgi:predicted nucleotidyltransferase